MAAETFLFNVNEDRFFLGESRKEKFHKKVCTGFDPPLDHLRMIDSLHRGYNINLALNPQRPGTFFGSNKCTCVFLPEEKKQAIAEKVKNDVPEDCGTTLSREDASCQTLNDDLSEIESSEESKPSKNSKKKKSKPKTNQTRPKTESKKDIGDSPKTDETGQLDEIKCMLKKLLDQPEDERKDRKKSSVRTKPCFASDECRKCSLKICLRCRMHLDSCCCGTPNFLFCNDCEGKYKSPNCSNKDPFACRMCDQKLCLVCKQSVESCPCPKPNFFFCRLCDAKIKTRCCIPGTG